MDAGNQEDQLIVLAYCDKNEATGEVTTSLAIFQCILHVGLMLVVFYIVLVMH